MHNRKAFKTITFVLCFVFFANINISMIGPGYFSIGFGSNAYASGEAVSPWPTTLGNGRNTCTSSYPGPEVQPTQIAILKNWDQIGGVAVGTDGTIYACVSQVVGYDDEGRLCSKPYLVAIDGTYYNIKWQTLLDNNAQANLYPDGVTVTKDNIICAATCYGIYAVNPDGTLKWAKNYGYPPYALQPYNLALTNDNGQVAFFQYNPSFTYNVLVRIFNVSDGTLVKMHDIRGGDYHTHPNVKSTFVDSNNNFYIQFVTYEHRVYDGDEVLWEDNYVESVFKINSSNYYSYSYKFQKTENYPPLTIDSSGTLIPNTIYGASYYPTPYPSMIIDGYGAVYSNSGNSIYKAISGNTAWIYSDPNSGPLYLKALGSNKVLIASRGDSALVIIGTRIPPAINLSVNGVTNSSLSVTWTPNGNYGSITYNLVLQDPVNGTWLQNPETKGTSYTFTGLASNTQYNLWIRGRSDAYAYTEFQLFGQPYTYSNPPSSVSWGNITDTSFNVFWQPNGNPAYTQYQAVLVDYAGTYWVSNSDWQATNSWNFGGLLPATKYHVYVRSRNVNGTETGWVYYGTVQTAGSLPSPSATATSNTINVSWPAVPGATGYSVEKDGTVVDNGPSTIYYHKDLAPNSQHNYRVMARNAISSTEWSAYLTKWTMVAQPAGGTCTSGTSSISLAWNAVSGATGYEVYEGAAKIYDGPDTTCTHPGAPGSVHTFKVRAKNANGPGDFSPDITKSVLPSGPQIDSLSATATKDSVTFSWGAVSGASRYDIKVGAQSFSQTSTTFNHTGLTPGTEYDYQVSAWNGSNGPWTSFSKWTRPGAPQNITVSANSTSITLRWSPVQGATGYRVEKDGSSIETVAGTAFTHNVSQGTQHSYRVCAYNESGDGDWSVSVSKWALTSAPQNLRMVSATDNQIDIEWGPVERATGGYNLYVDGELKVVNLRSTSYVHSSLTSGTKHTYLVAAVNGENKEGDNSLPIEAWTKPSIPANLHTIDITSSMIKLGWETVTGATEYWVEIDGKWVSSGTSNELLHNVAPGSTHTYSVKAHNTSGDSAPSPEIAVLSLPDRPAGLTAEAGKTTVKLSWISVQSATGYVIKVNDDDNYIYTVAEPQYNVTGLESDTPYKFSVAAVNATGSGNYTEIYETTLPLEPDTPVITRLFPTSDKINVYWSSPDRATGFDLKADSEYIDKKSATSHAHNGLAPGTEHRYSVSARNEGGSSPYSAEHVKWTLPGIPQNVSASATDVAINLTWDPVLGATGYEVEIDSDPTNIADNGNSTTFTHGALPSNSTHTYEVRARNSSGSGAWCLPIIKTTMLNTPQDVRSTVTSSSMTVSWNQVANATGYEVKIGDTVNTVTGAVYTTFSRRDLMPETQYTYSVRAVNGANRSEWSTQLNKATLQGAPGVPVNINATSLPGAITVKWDSVERAKGYEIEVDGKLINNGNSTAYTHSGIEPGSQHYYRVRARNEGGKSGWSILISPSSFEGTIMVPSNLRATSTKSDITVMWDGVDGASLYDIEADGIQSSVTGTVYNHSGLAQGILHSYRIRAVGAAGTSEWSTYISKETLSETGSIPSNLKSIATGNAIMLTWDNTEGAIGYDVEVDGSVVSVTSSVYSHDGLSANSQHAYRVRAVLPLTGAGEWSCFLYTNTLVETYDIPSNIRATATDKKITVIWDTVISATGYNIEVDGVQRTVAKAVYEHTYLQPNTMHQYRIQTVSPARTSGWSNLITQSTQPKMKYVPTNLTAQSSDTSVTLTWNKLDGAKIYIIEKDGSQTISITSNQYIHTGLQPQTQHSYRVKAVSDIVYGDFSDVLIVTTLPSRLPDVPENLSANPSGTSVVLSWDAVNGVTGYDVELEGASTATVTSSTYTHSGLMVNSSHSYRVRAFNQYGPGSWSAPISVNTMKWDAIQAQIIVDGYINDWNAISPIAIGSGVVNSLYAVQDSSKLYILIKGTDVGVYNDVFIDSDNNGATGGKHAAWPGSGVEYHICDRALYKYIGDGTNWEWAHVGDIDINRSSGVVEMAIDLNRIGRTSPGEMKIGYERGGIWDCAPLRESALATANMMITGTQTAQSVEARISVDGYIMDWSGINPVSAGSGAIEGLWAVQSNNKLYLMVKGTDMGETNAVFIDTDNKGSTGLWNWSWANSGAEYWIDNSRLNRHTGPGQEWGWEYVGQVNISKSETAIEYSIDLSQIGMAGPGEIKVSYNCEYDNYAPARDNSMVAVNLRIKEPLPGVPSNVAGTVTQTSATLTWESVAEADSYEIEVDGVLTGNTSVTSYTYGGQQPGTTHLYRMRAKNTSGVSQWSQPVAMTTHTILQAKIEVDGNTDDWSLISSISNGQGTVNSMYAVKDTTKLYILVKGTNLSGASDFFIDTDMNPATGCSSTGWTNGGADYLIENGGLFRSTGSGFTWQYLKGVNYFKNDTTIEISVNLSDLGLLEPRSMSIAYYRGYQYVDTAPQIGGNMALADSCISGSRPVPETPEIISASPGQTSVSLLWNKADWADSYDIEIDSAPAGNTSVTSFVYGGLKSNTSYKLRIRAKNESGTSDWSTSLTVNTNSRVPAKITIDGDVTDWYLISPIATGTGGVEKLRAVQDDGKLYVLAQGININEWCDIYIDTDNDSSTGASYMQAWPNTGADYMIENGGLFKWSTESNWWSYIGSTSIYISNNTVECSVNLNQLGLSQPKVVKISYSCTNGMAPVQGSSQVSVTTFITGVEPVPAAPSSNIIIAANETTINLAWDAVPGASGYDIESDGTIIEDITSTSYSFAGLTPGTSHTFRIRGRNTSGAGEWSVYITKATLVQIPANIRTTSAANEITIEWDTASGATEYILELDGAKQMTVTGTVYSHKNLASGTQHTYKVKGRNQVGESYWTPITTAMTLIEGLDAPVNLYAVSAVDTITVTWDAYAGALGYEIEADGTVVSTGTNTSYIHSGLLSGSQHTYRVRADRGGAKTDWSTMLVQPTMLGVPLNIRAMATDIDITVTWDLMMGTEGYEIEVDGVTASTGTSNTYVHSGLSPITQHNYRVRAVKGTEKGEWSAVISVLTLADMHSAPKNFKADAMETSIALSWDGMAGAIGYEIEADGTIVDNGTNTVYNHGGLLPGTQHTYRVRAQMEGVYTNWSAPLIKATMLGVPAGLRTTATDTAVTVMWDEVSGALSYDLETDEIIRTVTDTTYTHAGLAPNTYHTYRVRAKNSVSTSEWSQSVTGSTKTSTFQISLYDKKEFNYMIEASDIYDFSLYTFTVTYNKDDLDVIDLYSTTPKLDIGTGPVTGTGIDVSQNSNGIIIFTVNKPIAQDSSWSGLVTGIKFRSKKASGTTSINYEAKSSSN